MDKGKVKLTDVLFVATESSQERFRERGFDNIAIGAPFLVTRRVGGMIIYTIDVVGPDGKLTRAQADNPEITLTRLTSLPDWIEVGDER